MFTASSGEKDKKTKRELQDNVNSNVASALAAAHENNVDSVVSNLARNPSEMAILKQYLNQRPQIAHRLQVASTVSAGTLASLSTFLKLVAEGEQDKAEKLLWSNPDLGLVSGYVTDLADRSFENITALQYAVWALDWHMWTMILKYLPIEEARKQLQGMEKGSWVKQHGISASWQNLIDALQTYIDNYKSWTDVQLSNHWSKEIGGAQRLLPAHVINEYCHPDRPFEPCPDFTEAPLPRTRNTNTSDINKGEWYAVTYNKGKLGESFAYMRHSFNSACIAGRTPGYLSCDLKACQTLLDTRMQQRDRLLAEFREKDQKTKRESQDNFNASAASAAAHEGNVDSVVPGQARRKQRNRISGGKKLDKIGLASLFNEPQIDSEIPTEMVILNQLQNQKPQVDLKINAETLNTILEPVAEGEQDKAEELQYSFNSNAVSASAAAHEGNVDSVESILDKFGLANVFDDPKITPSIPAKIAILNQFQNQKPQVDLKINAETRTFLTLVAEGEQDKAEKLLKSNLDLALASGDVTDLSYRPFKGITAFQYAVWALDWHMWTMILKYLPIEAAREQLHGMEKGSWVKEYGVSVSSLLQKYIDNYEAVKQLRNQSQSVSTLWIKYIGGFQRRLPAHIVNEYCRLDRSFKPCPDFTEGSLPRTRRTNVGEWYTAKYKKHELGETFAYLRSLFNSPMAEDDLQYLEQYVCADLEACQTLLDTRVQQHDQLFVKLSVNVQAQGMQSGNRSTGPIKLA